MGLLSLAGILFFLGVIGASAPNSLSNNFPKPQSQDPSQACSPLYSVALDHYGPEPTVAETIKHPHVIAPTQHEPLKVLPHPPIPPPKLISHRIVHYKTYMRPQVYQRIITVPKVYRFLKRGSHPIVEHIPYKAKPLLPDTEPSSPISGLNSLGPQTPIIPNKLVMPQLPLFPPFPKLSCPQFVC